MPYLVYRKNEGALIPVSSFFSPTELADFLKEKLSLSEDDSNINLTMFKNGGNFDLEIEGFLVQCRENFSFQEIADFYGEDVSATRQRFRRSLIKMRTDRVGNLLREFAARMERKNDSQYIFGLN